MKVLFLDCFSGISGDMTVGALVDLGVKPSTLEWELSKLDLGDFHMHFERKQRQQVEGVKFGIHEGATHTHEQDEEGKPCEGHHEHEHGHADEHNHEHHHEEAHAHEHGHEHHHHDEDEKHEHAHADKHEHEHHEHEHHEHEHYEHEKHEHGHEHHHHEREHAHHEEAHDHDHGSEVDCHHEHSHGRNHHEIRELIVHSELSAFVKKHALSIFRRIAEAEGKIHGQPADDVQFHEVGALDSIADIICACAGIEALGVEKVFVSSLHDGSGTVTCAHGTFPLPTPATLEILKGIPLGQIDEPHELITPTGAAIAAEFGASFGPMPQIKIEKIGYGVGSRDLKSRPNVLRAVLGTLVED
jgi:uncharacterized protein (DUF111 family)